MASIISAGTSSNTALNVTADTSGSLVLATNSGTTALTLNTSQNATFAGSVNAPNTFGFKNRIINGAMVIDQRNAGASVTPTASGYTLDRWRAVTQTSSKYSVQQSSTAPTGFINSILMTSLSAYSVSSSEWMGFQQAIEGLNIADLGWGTANAKTVTFSFWVRSSLTGTFGGSLANNDASRSYPFSYTISSANTWEQKSITIAGDTTGTWLTTNGIGIRVTFGTGVGSNFLNTAGAWASGEYYGATGEVSVVGTNGATFYITGVQLEVGSQATSFDYRDYGRELIMCQRYYSKYLMNTGTYAELVSQAQSATRTQGSIPLQVTMRSSPTLTKIGGTMYLQGSAGAATASLVNYGSSINAVSFDASGNQNFTTAGGAASFYTDVANTGFAFSAEL